MKSAPISAAVIALLRGCVKYTSTYTDAPRPQSQSLSADIRRMWETEPLRSRPRELASTERAVAAADRVFSTVDLRGKTREQLISLLGDPKHSSHSTYNFPFYPAPADSLVYRFDTGAGGWQFNLLFDRQNRVRKVERYGIE